MDIEQEIRWNELVSRLEPKFGEGLDLESILFLIGVQELGHGHKKFTKDQKIDVMHIAICTLLSNYGYYDFVGLDKDEWPHWEPTKKLPFLGEKEQKELMKKAVLEYFEQNNVHT